MKRIQTGRGKGTEKEKGIVGCQERDTQKRKRMTKTRKIQTGGGKGMQEKKKITREKEK